MSSTIRRNTRESEEEKALRNKTTPDISFILKTMWCVDEHAMLHLRQDKPRICKSFMEILMLRTPLLPHILEFCQYIGLRGPLKGNFYQIKSGILKATQESQSTTTPATKDPEAKDTIKATPESETTPSTKETTSSTKDPEAKDTIIICRRKGRRKGKNLASNAGEKSTNLNICGLCPKVGINRPPLSEPISKIMTLSEIFLILGIFQKGKKTHRLSNDTCEEDKEDTSARIMPHSPSLSETVTRAAKLKLKGSRESETTPEEENILTVRWSLQDEIAKLFNLSLKAALCRWEGGVSCSISPCPIEAGDYLCTNVAETWSELRMARYFRGPTDAGLTVRRNIMLLDSTGMIERCVVCGPGFVMFKLSMKWITKSIHKMVKDGIGTCAPKLSVERAILYFLSGNIAEKMHTGHLRSTVIGETLARILEYSGVEMIRRFHEEDVIELKMITELLIERFPNGIVHDLSPGEFEVLYKESKERFDEDAQFRERVQQLQSQGWDERHRNAWVQVSKISRERNQKVYERLGVHKVSCFEPFDSSIIETIDLPREIESEGDEAIRRKFSVDLAALWHALNVVGADWILHVTDVGQRDHFEMCISAAKRAGWIVNDSCPFPLSHVGFGLVQADDYERLRTLSTTVVYLVNLLDEAKIRCKAALVGQGKADDWIAEELEHTAEALGYGAVKYALLKNNRLTKCTINFDEMLNEKGNTVVYLHYTHAQICSIIGKHGRGIKKLKELKGEKVEELIFKNNEERALGLHLLRFTEVLGEVCTVLMPHILCEYLYDLCKKFDSFYSRVYQVVGYGKKTSKLLLCEATAMVMRKCFHLLGITPIYKKILKWRPGSKLSKRLYFSDLTEQQLMALFCKGPCFRFDLCKVVLTHSIDVRVENRSSYNKLLLVGFIKAETHISDPSQYGSFNILNRNIDDPLVITELGSLSPHDICYCSLSVSTFVKITAKLYGTTYMGDGVESYSDYRKYYPDKENDPEYLLALKNFLKTGIFPILEVVNVGLDDDAFEVCNGNVCINMSEYFANNGGGSGSCKLKGKDGYLDLYYVALKYAVEAALEVGFVATCKETKVFGRVMAYYGKNFCYDCPASERDLYKAMLFEVEKPSHIEAGKINLPRSVLGVPAQYSLIVEAELHDFTSGDMILSGVCELFVPIDGSSSFGFINGNDCFLNLKVDWKLPLDMLQV